MRVYRLPRRILSICALTCLCVTPVLAKGNPGALPDDKDKSGMPTGLNSTINVAAAQLAIDDKSPMANSIGGGSEDGVTKAYGFVDKNAETILKVLLKRGLKGLQELQGPRDLHGPQGLWSLALPSDASTQSVKKFQDALQTLITSGQFPISGDKVLKFKTQTFLKTHMGRLGTVIANRFILRDLLMAYADSLVDYDEAQQIRQAAPLTDEQYHRIEENLPLNIVQSSLYVGVQVRSGGQPTVYAPEAIYSNGRAGYDVAAQYYDSSRHGYGIGFRFDLTPGRAELISKVLPLLPATERINKSPNPPEDPELDEEDSKFYTKAQKAAIIDRVLRLDVYRAEYDPAKEAAIEAAIRYSERLRVAFVATQRGIGGVGSFTSAGASVSQLWVPRPSKPYNGVTFLASAQALLFAPDNGENSSIIRSGVAIFWQDRVSRMVDDNGHKRGEINRWTTQFGAEYNFHNYLQPHDIYGFFARQRLEKFTELSFSVSKGDNGRAFFGFSVGHTFSM